MSLSKIRALYRRAAHRLPVVLLAGAALIPLNSGSVQAAAFSVTNLVTSNQAAYPAQVLDPNLKNAWGISSSPTSPLWVSDNATGVTTLYSVNPVTNATSISALVVGIPGDGSVTGQTFSNVAGSFNSNVFLFASEDGTLSGWRGALGTSAEVLQVASPSNVYKGATLLNTAGNTYLLTANFRAGTIDVLKGAVGMPDLGGKFVDPTIPAGYAPFNVQVLGGKVYVTYAKQDATGHDEVPGAGNGFVDAYDLDGNFIQRLASNGPLDAPWGLAIAPASFDGLAGDLLVGNFGDGRINAFDSLGNSLGALTDANGAPISIDGLWALRAGNGGNGGSPNAIYFSAGPLNETEGLFGVLTPVPEPASLTVLAMGLGGLGLMRRRRG